MNRTARLRPNCRRLVFGLLLVCSWIFAPALPGQPLRAEAGTATITGKVFYNDRRTFGHFSARRDKAGSPGRRCPKAGQRDDRTSCSTNPLGARYMVVDIIEIDQGFFGPTAWACKKEEIIGSATVKYDGSFTVTVSTDDACKSDGLKVTQVKLSVRTRFCNDTWCISLRDDKRNVYALLHPGASAKKPLKIKAGKTYDVGTMTFSTGGDSSRPTVEGMAANYWASIVDTALTLHNEGGLPFFRNEYGELEYLFPSDKSSTATARSNDEIVISKFQYDTIQVGTVTTRVPAWPSGWTPAHEYGHIVMQRAWGGGYGYKGVGISANDTAIANDPARQIAFKEAWAEFIARVVFDEQAGCGLSSFDINSNTPANGPFGQGASWRSNVTKALCDWYDSRKDDDPGQPGRGDYFAASDIGSMWLNLRSMYVYRKDYGGDYKNPGLWFCDWVSYYLDVRKSAKAVGTAEHARYEDKIRDLIYNNKIGCYMSAPS